jgi:NTE family protein
MDARSVATAYEGQAGPEGFGRVALVLQGGGALGAYQAGVYEALHEAGLEPDWVSGVSIGAVNAALIAGNPPERRLERLTAFWERITDRVSWPPAPDGDVFRKAQNLASALKTLLLGQPDFFRPRPVSPWLTPAGARSATSYYDTAPLRATLSELVDFDRINARSCRFSVGAVNVLSGNFIFFDNADTLIEPEHVMASGALPPAFGAVRIGTDFFWDGGLVSNTPLQHLLDQEDDRSALIFQVDLFSARGPLPRTLEDVLSRSKDIMYSSRTRQVTDMHQRLQEWKAQVFKALSRLPPAELAEDERALLQSLARLPAHSIIQLIYQQKIYEGNAKDYEFSAASMREHWTSGRDDTRRALSRKDWLAPPKDAMSIVTHDVHRESSD